VVLYEQHLLSGGAQTPFGGENARGGAATLALLAAALLARPLSLLRALLVRLFLPRGSLPPEYLLFQALDSLQALCSYLRGVLTLHATLEGLGVSGSGAALSATLALLLKEGASHCAGLLFAFLAASRLDAEVRWWRLAADVANDVGLALELAAPLGGPRFFLPLTCAANACKAVCGVAAGATRVAISAHFAGGGGGSSAHVAEVAAKEGTQETAVTLAGILLGVALAPRLNASLAAQWAAFAALTAVHVAANAAAVRCLALRTLSRTRAALLLRAVAAGAPPPSPADLRRAEPLYPVHFTCGGGRGRGWEGGALRLGCALAEVARLGGGGGGGDWRAAASVRWLAPGGALCSAPLLGAAEGGGGGAREPGGGDWFLAAVREGEAAVAFSRGARPATLLAGWAWAVARLHGHGEAAAARLAAELLRGAAGAGWAADGCALDEEGFRVGIGAQDSA